MFNACEIVITTIVETLKKL